VNVFLAVEFLERFEFVNQSSVLVFENGNSVFQTADVFLFLATAFLSRLSVHATK